MGAEIRIDLDERVDKDGKKYLFGSIPFLNMVMFVREHNGRSHASLRPYMPKPPRPDSAEAKTPTTR